MWEMANAGKSPDSLLTGLLAYWKLDEASGNAIDSSGNGYTLTQSNNPLGVAGKVGNARQFVAASLQALYHAAILFPDTDFTISAWVNITTLTDFKHIINKWTTTNKGQMAAYINGNKIEWAIYTDSAIIGSVVNCATFGNLSTGTWYHMILERNKSAGTIRIGINLTFDTAAANGVIGSTAGFRLGIRESFSSGAFNGLIDEVGIWTRLLTVAEMTRLYNA